MSSPDTPRIGPQQALEMAALEAIRAGLPWSAKDSGRTWDGMPPAIQSGFFLSVWSPSDRRSISRTSLEEDGFGYRVTLTAHAGKRQRRDWHQTRDELQLHLDAIRALLHMDALDHRVIRAANVLMGREPTDGTSPSPARRIGFVVATMFQGFDPVEEKGPAWFGGEGGKACGLAQTARFGGSKLAQAFTSIALA